jgi:hypothetical protein
MVAEVVVAAGSQTIVSHNVRDFSGIGEFGIEVVTPGAFLRKLKGRR